MSQRRLQARRFVPGDVTAGATVSVVIPCYNYARYLPQAVRSVLDQPAVTVDVVIVDDASTDDSVAVATALAAGDPRVRLLANEQNSGPVETFNRGLAQAKGEFLVRLDADDLLTPGSLGRAVAVMKALPSVGLVYGHPIHFSGSELPAARTGVDGWLVWSGMDWLAARCADGTNVITSPEVLMRRSIVDVVGGQRPLAHTHDMEMWLRLAAHGDVAYILGADQAWHREHAASLSLAADDPLVILPEIHMAFETLFDGLGATDPDQLELRERSRRAVAGAALSAALHDADLGRRSGERPRLQQFAAETDPTIVATREWRRLARRAARGRSSANPLGVLARAGRRVRNDLRWRRWHSTGVYERLQVQTAGAPR